MRLLLALLVSTSASAAEVVLDRVAAIVNDEVITLSEVYDQGSEFIDKACKSPFGASGTSECVKEKELEVIDRLVEEVLVRQKLADVDMDISQADIDQGVEQVVLSAGATDRAQLRQMVESEGWEWETFKEFAVVRQMRTRRFQQVFIVPQVMVSDNDVLDHYNRTMRDMPTESKREIGALRVPLGTSMESSVMVKASLADVAESVNVGDVSWADAVQQHDAGTYKGQENGTMGVFKRADMAEVFGAVFDAEVGKVVGPIIVQNSAFLLVTLKDIPLASRSFDDAKEDIRDNLFVAKVEEETKQWYVHERRRAVVKVLLE